MAMEDSARTGELRRKLEKDPGSRLFAQLAEELRKEGRHDEAISVARGGLEKNPNYPSARLTLARALLDSGRAAEAKPELENIVKGAPDNIMASRLLGEALAELGQVEQALEQFEKTLRISPGDKVVIERIAATRARLASMAAAASAPSAPAASPAETPASPAELPAFGSAPLPSVLPEAPLPSVFDAGPATVPAVNLAALPAFTLAPAAIAPPAPVPPAPAGANLALDRDLASGTFSPGSLSAAEIQKHFDEVAESEKGPSAAPPRAQDRPQEAPKVELPAAADDLGGQTLPLTSVTLADLYLQQGLKKEASAVLSQVLKEEPDNAQARSRFAAVEKELAPAMPEVSPAVASAAPPGGAVEVPVAPPKRRSRAEIREQTILSLKAFADAAEREMIHQKATERTA
jgi:tetratricopeptide (TPR) repeat protein